MASEIIETRLCACVAGLYELSLEAMHIANEVDDEEGNPLPNPNGYDYDVWSTLGCISSTRKYVHCAGVTTTVCLQLHRWMEYNGERAALVPNEGFLQLDDNAEKLQDWGAGPLNLRNDALLKECVSLFFTPVVKDDAVGHVMGRLQMMMFNAANLASTVQRFHDRALQPGFGVMESANLIYQYAVKLKDDMLFIAESVGKLSDYFSEAAKQGRAVRERQRELTAAVDITLIYDLESQINPKHMLAKALTPVGIEYLYATG